MAYERDPNEVGALWVKDGQRGEYMTGTITAPESGEQIKVVCFRNSQKRSDKSPDWRVLKSTPRGE